jgi:hypothetical protein
MRSHHEPRSTSGAFSFSPPFHPLPVFKNFATENTENILKDNPLEDFRPPPLASYSKGFALSPQKAHNSQKG